jgi:HEPN domain-containing protein
MTDIDKQIAYWQESAKEDWEVALELVSNNRLRHGLFFAHLTLEKMLKALVCKGNQQSAPKIHNLIRLSQIANMTLTNDQFDILADMNPFNIEGRYTDSLLIKITKEETQGFMNRAEEMFKWLIKQL